MGHIVRNTSCFDHLRSQGKPNSRNPRSPGASENPAFLVAYDWKGMVCCLFGPKVCVGGGFDGFRDLSSWLTPCEQCWSDAFCAQMGFK